jgi:steroid 5-alpha reductase family enzyme
VANPNYLGEVIEWFGYSLVSGHENAFMFAFSTINVLTPAAIVRNNWNKKNIQNYPKERTAIFPYLL